MQPAKTIEGYSVEATAPLLSLDDVTLEYSSGQSRVVALCNVNITIHAGEMVAIMGASGSGKSSLMNILGCLDTPTHGRYYVGGVDTFHLPGDELAKLRQRSFGFVFQRYNLLPKQDALRNVAMPALYAGLPPSERKARALELLKRVGLEDRQHHSPAEMSGGQQQRVSIARALINGGEVILADEPTGALDSQTGQEVLELLSELNALGHTVVIVTHDAEVAAHAPRLIELRDGRVVRDVRTSLERKTSASNPTSKEESFTAAFRARLDQVVDACCVAVESLLSHRLRSALSIFGITVGIAAVATTVALGNAVRDKSNEFAGHQASRVSVTRGNPDLPPNSPTRGFDADDVSALTQIPSVEQVDSALETSLMAQRASRSGTTRVEGKPARTLTRQFFDPRLDEGRLISELDVESSAHVAILNKRAKDLLFEAGSGSAVGATILLRNISFEVVGTTLADDRDWEPVVLVPSSVFRNKLVDARTVDRLDIRLQPGSNSDVTTKQVRQTLMLRHGVQDFEVGNRDEQLRRGQAFVSALQLGLSGIAALSLLVGGVGVLNIMLVGVSERIREIGIRLAVGARPADIQLQFLTESVLLCFVGGCMGILIAVLAMSVINHFQHDLPVQLSVSALGVAIAVSSLVGIAFGFVPARQASLTRPVVALSRE